MNAVIDIAAGLGAGGFAGAFYFLGLLWTTRRVVSATHPVPLMLGSFVVRSALAVGVFFPLVKLSIVATIAGMVGFLLARHVIVGSQRKELAR